MAKKILVITASVFIVLISGCSCREIITCTFTAEEEQLIGMYKTGNWWVYNSTDGTKSDSVYVTNMDTIYEVDNKAKCNERPIIKGIIKSSFFSNINTENDVLFGKTRHCNGIEIEIQNEIGSFFYLSTHSNLLQFNKSINWAGSNFDSLYQWQSGNKVEVFFEKNIGVVGWINISTSDSFIITNYFIQ